MNLRDSGGTEQLALEFGAGGGSFRVANARGAEVVVLGSDFSGDGQLNVNSGAGNTAL